ncbi:DMT family transporter [Granulosicoccaceae sp. 1_MG-2023]|nr:DMT family transporter [Granulosicoccaceae sp. 1_MG-2023]
MALRIIILLCVTMLAFSANSLLARYALSSTSIDPASFTLLRLASGAALLALLLSRNGRSALREGSFAGALALFIYAATLSFSYSGLDTGLGALLLFCAVQITMIGTGLWKGERFNLMQSVGFFGAMAGLVYLLAPGANAPDLHASVLMLASGFAWGVYSIMGRGSTRPLAMTAGNFLRAVPFALLLSLVFIGRTHWDSAGAAAAVASGMFASGCGYALWYHILPQLSSSVASSVQLTVPVIASMLGWLFLDELWTLRLSVASVLVLGGIYLVIRGANKRDAR